MRASLIVLATLLSASVALADVKPTVTSKGPNGLFFMTRFWPATGSLEKSVWYFAPDGTVYRNLQDGFSKEDLAAHQGPKGTWKLTGDTLDTVMNGKKVSSKFKGDKGGFSWDAGIFTGVKPFRDAKSLAGRYEGGESLAGVGGRITTSKSLVLNPDGTFTWEGVAFAKSTTSASTVTSGGQSGTTGRWKVSDYSLTLTSSDGTALRKIAFPYDDEKTPVTPDYMYFGGTMYKRK